MFIKESTTGESLRKLAWKGIKDLDVNQEWYVECFYPTKFNVVQSASNGLNQNFIQYKNPVEQGVLRAVEKIQRDQRDTLNSVDSTVNGRILTYLDNHFFL